MKSKMKRRMLAIVLCMVIALSNSSFIFASSGTEEPAAVAQEGDPQNVQEAQTEAAVQDTPAVLSETTPEATPEATPEPTQVPEVTAAPTEAPQTTAEPTQAPEVTAAPEATPAPTETPAVTAEPTQAPEITPTPTPEVTAAPEATPVPTEAPVTYNEAVELKHEFKDENGNVTATVTAQIPAGAFQADASELTMEVTVPDQATTEHVKKLMEESLPEHYMLGDTVLYDIRFKVNGTETESQQPIVITFENQNGITVKDVKKAVVFQLDPADPAVEGDKDELVTITQRNDMIESLQNSGQSTDNVDDYDLSEITLKEDGTSNKIQMEGRTSTIYGCYAYYEPVQVLTYEDDQVTVTVSAAENGVIPANAELKVVPITEDKETEDQYKDVEKKLQEKAEEEEYEIAGFLAYDITFVDPDGNETEPNGEVKVSIDYKEAAIPESVSEEDAQNAEVTVLHLEEDEKGEVKEVVDMAQTEKVDVLATTEENKVEKAEVKTESFSTFVIQWKYNNNYGNYFTINAHYVYVENGEYNDIPKEDIDNYEDPWKEILNSNINNIDLSKYQLEIPGYTYLRTTADNEEGDEINQLQKGYSYYGPYYYIDHDGTSDYDHWLSTGYYGTTIGNIYFVYQKEDSSEGGSDDETNTLGTPDHNKYITQNSIDDYTLSLDVTGKRGEESGIDVLLVIDKSGSMDDTKVWVGNQRKNLLNAIKDIVENKIVPSVLTDDKTINSIAAVSFSSNSYTGADISTEWKSYDNKQELINSVKNISANGGTNWELAMRKAENKLKERKNSNNQKVVIFLSDGAPGYYFNNYGGEDGVGDPTAGSNAAQKAMQEAVNYVNGSTYLKKASIYSVYLTDGTKNEMTDFADGLKTKGVSASAIDGTDVEKSLTDLIESIVTPEYTNVSIEDTLSEYVDLTAEPQYKVTKTTADGTTTDLESSKYKCEYIEETKTVKVTLLNGAALEEGVKYTVSFHITPNENAKNAYIENGDYLHVGEEGTGESSAGQKGFYSNDTAVVKYQENDGLEQKAEYKHPVVQIDMGSINIPETPNPTDGSITKTMGDATTEGQYPITLEVKTRQEKISEAANVDVILVIDVSNSMENNSRLSNTKTAAKEFVKNFVGAEGTVSETHRVGIVTFGSKGEILTYGGYGEDTQYFSGDATVVDQKIDDIKLPGEQSGGTNTEAGFTKAKELAKETLNNTYVIFLTDGVPTYHGEETKGGYVYSEKTDFNNAVDAAKELEREVEGIYTIGLLDGANEQERDIARTLLASNNSDHQAVNYDNTYKLLYSEAEVNEWTGKYSNWNYTWDKTSTHTYSDGYFEVTSQNAATELQAIWTQLATIINNQEIGSTGSGWIVTDQMADYTTFLSLKGAEINGYELTLNDEGTILTTVIDDKEFTVATYDKDTITWYLNDVLAEKSIKYNHGIDYTYRLTYYVDFEDTDSTEFRPTNESTYVTPKENPDEKIYPDKMPFFVNVVGNKVDAEKTEQKLANATFKVYKDKNKTQLLTTMTSDENGHFAFQLGQSDFTMTSENGTVPESYSMTVYLEETSAPQGYVADTVLHPVTINITNVTYSDGTAGGVQKGSPSGTVAIQTSDQNDKLSVDNTEICLVYKNAQRPSWGIVKRNGNNTALKLSGAEFELYKLEGEEVANDPSYKGTSNEKGVIDRWTDLKTNTSTESRFIEGEYVLKETKAPANYSLSTVQWKVQITKTDVTITLYNASGSQPVKVSNGEMTELNLTGSYYYFDNVMLYDLPSAGGSGIFWYLISGTAFMMAASLILYRMKRKEVLGK